MYSKKKTIIREFPDYDFVRVLYDRKKNLIFFLYIILISKRSK